MLARLAENLFWAGRSTERARENARSVRELLSSELWEAINDLHLVLGDRDLEEELLEQPYELFRTVRRMRMTIYGVASETMPRDEGWRCMALGRLLERDLPRSVLFCLGGALRQLEVLRDDRPSRAARQLGRTTASPEFRDVGELFDVGLQPFLEEVQEQVAATAQQIADEFFHHHPGGALHAIATG